MTIHKIEHSSSVTLLEHKAERKELHITWASGQQGYYDNVDTSMFTRLLNSESKGKYIYDEIRSNPKKHQYFSKASGTQATIVKKKSEKTRVSNSQKFQEKPRLEELTKISSKFHELIRESKE